jgi:hypothetical protein
MERSDVFPPNFPSELVTGAFVASKEAAWRPAQAAVSVEWLGAHGFAVLGTELWLPKDGSIQSLPYFQNVDRQGDEAWIRLWRGQRRKLWRISERLPPSSSRKAMSTST